MPRLRPSCSFCQKESVYKLTPQLLLFLGVSDHNNKAARVNGVGRFNEGGYFSAWTILKISPQLVKKGGIVEP